MRWLLTLLFLLVGCAAAVPAPALVPTPTLEPDWQRYEAEEGQYAILLRSSGPLQEFQQQGEIAQTAVTIYGVQASYYDNERQAIIYFQHPEIENGTLTAVDYLNTFDINRFSANAILENVQETSVQLGTHPGREWLFQLSDAGVTQLEMRVRVYVVNSTVYQLTLGSLYGVTNETADRFINSFTLR